MNSRALIKEMPLSSASLWQRVKCFFNQHNPTYTGRFFHRNELRVEDPEWLFSTVHRALASESELRDIWRTLTIKRKIPIFRCACGCEFVPSISKHYRMTPYSGYPTPEG